MNLIRKWRRVMAVGCTHGELANKEIQKQVLAFKHRYQPEVVLDLGDVVDTTPFRGGAHGSADESKEVEPDELAAVNWLLQYEPTHLSWGNHCWRLIEAMNSPNALVAHAAKCVWRELQGTLKTLKTKTVPYVADKNWFEIGGTYWGHGFWYGEHAVRDTAEYLGGPVVMAHLHRPHMVSGRTRKWTQSYCVGTLADIDKLKYAERRRATALWGHGVVFGEVSADKAQLWLASCEKNGELRFPA